MKPRNLVRTLMIGALSTVASVGAQAQQGDVLLTVGNDKITKQEFETIYRKNNLKQTTPPDEKTLKEYLDLYINFRLKVKEAEVMGLDTTKEFKQELAGYRKQLAQPYLNDKEVTDKLIEEAYQHSLREVRACHILINCGADASPADTLAAYNKIVELRNRIVKKGEDFASLAQQYSEDPSAKQNKGDLGYFSAFTMVYPFESAAFTNKIGNVSQPVRTRFGYHIIKTVDERPAQGEIKAAHIMIRTPKGMASKDSLRAKTKIDSIYSRIKAGDSFEELAKQFSEDKMSARNGGALQPFSTGRMVQEFEDAAFALKNNGDVSVPVKTVYGWHIIKRVEKKPLPTFDEVKNEIKNKVQRDSRSELNKQSFISKRKKEYNFTEDLKARNEFYTLNDSNLVKGNWKAAMAKDKSKPLFTLNGKTFAQQDFAKYVEEKQFMVSKASVMTAINNLYDLFVEKTITDYEDSRLEQKYPDFKALMQEYRDGILLFELTDDMVWSKAVKDTTGLQEFFNKNNGNYKWGERLDAVVYTCKDDKIAADVRKLMKNKKISQDSLLSRVNKDNPLNLTIKSGKFERGENAIIDGMEWKKGMTKNIPSGNAVAFVNVKETLAPQLKTLNEVRGAATADYQNYLEKEWITALRAKYPVAVNESVFKSMIQ